jgi:hypothetical protein
MCLEASCTLIAIYPTLWAPIPFLSTVQTSDCWGWIARHDILHEVAHCAIQVLFTLCTSTQKIVNLDLRNCSWGNAVSASWHQVLASLTSKVRHKIAICTFARPIAFNNHIPAVRDTRATVIFQCQKVRLTLDANFRRCARLTPRKSFIAGATFPIFKEVAILAFKAKRTCATLGLAIWKHRTILTFVTDEGIVVDTLGTKWLEFLLAAFIAGRTKAS